MKIQLVFLLTILSPLFAQYPPQNNQNPLALPSNIQNPSSKSIDSIFSSLPSETDLQLILYSADAVSLSKLLQVI